MHIPQRHECGLLAPPFNGAIFGGAYTFSKRKQRETMRSRNMRRPASTSWLLRKAAIPRFAAIQLASPAGSYICLRLASSSTGR
jgi:hypothetical protein